MPKKGHSEEEIVRALLQAKAGQKVSDICREMAVIAASVLRWKRHYAGLALSGARTAATARGDSEAKTLMADLTSTFCFQKRSEARGAAPHWCANFDE
jgi:transposase-like protein